MTNRTEVVKLVYDGDVEAVQNLVTAKQGLAQRYGPEITPLHVAASLGNCDMIRLLMAPPCNPWEVLEASGDGQTPFHLACKNGHGDAAALMLEMRPEKILPLHLANVKDDQGWTPLLLACRSSCAPLVELLLQCGADVLCKAPDSQNTPLHIAVLKDSPLIVSHLIAAGVDVNAVNAQGVTPLICAAKDGSGSCTRLLVRAGADETTKDAEGSTAEDWATALENESVLRALRNEPGTPEPEDDDESRRTSGGSACSMCLDVTVHYNCLQCAAIYCHTCASMMHKKGTFHDHTLLNLDDETPLPPPTQGLLCGWCDHLSASLECKDCKMFLCQPCTAFIHDGTRRPGLAGHNTAPLPSAEASVLSQPLSQGVANAYLYNHDVIRVLERVLTEVLALRPISPVSFILDRITGLTGILPGRSSGSSSPLPSGNTTPTIAPKGPLL